MQTTRQQWTVSVLATALVLSTLAEGVLTVDSSNAGTVTRAQVNAALAGGGTLDVRSDFVLPDNILCPAGSEIAVGENVTLTLDSKREVNLAPGAYGPVRMTIANGGVFKFADASAHLNVPLDLRITGSGKIQKVYDVGDIYDPGAVVAHRIFVDGTELTGTRYFATDKPSWFDNGNGSGVVYRPWVWTGKGDGESWTDGANWDRGTAPDNGPNGIADVSAAVGKTLTFGNVRRTIGCVINYAPVEGGTVVLKNGPAGDFVLFTYANLCAVAMIGTGREIVFDANTYQGGSYSVLAVGGGRLSYRGGGLHSGDTASYIAVDGKFVVNGPCDVGDNALGCLGWYSPAGTEFLIEEGAQLKAGQLSFSFPGSYFLDMDKITQTGGDVTLSTGLYVGHQRSASMSDTRYRMEGGTLATPIVACGYKDPRMGAAKMWSGGFEMDGGTLTTDKIGCGLYGAWVTLRGGTIRLGAGGLELGNDDISGSGWQAPAEHWRLGGVKIVSTAPLATAHRNTSEAFRLVFDGVGGDTLFDTAGGEITLTDGVVLQMENDAGFSKCGELPLTVGSATVTGRGSIRVVSGPLVFGSQSSVGFDARCAITVEAGGTLSLLGSVGPLTTLELPSLGALTLPAADSVVTVSSLSVAGVAKGPGTYDVGCGKVTVAPAGSYAWIAPADGDWSEASNWKSGEIPSTALDLDFALSTVSSNSVINVPWSMWANHFYFGGGATGSELTLGGGGGYFIFGGSDRSVTVARNRTLRFGCGFRINGTNVKYGAGRLVMDEFFRCNPDLNESADRVFKVTDGELELNYWVQGLRTFPCSSDKWIVPKVTVGPDAHVGARLQTEIQLSDCNASADAYGEVVSSGAVNMVADANETRFDLATCRGGELKLTVNGGTFAFPKHEDGSFVNMRINGNATAEACHSFAFEQNGGLSSWPTVEWGFGDGERNVFTVNGGTMELNGPFVACGGGDAKVNLNGGALRFATASAGLGGIPVSVTGAAELEVPGDVTATPTLVLSGAGSVTKTGEGALFLDPAQCGVTNLRVQAGTFGFSADGNLAETTLSLDRGVKIDLNGRRVTVKRLNIRGKERVKGVYVASETCRHHEYFEGEGELVVLEGEEGGFTLLVR